MSAQRLCKLLIWLLLTPCAAWTTGISLVASNGFCPGGGVNSPLFQTWGSFCDKGVANVGQAVSSTFQLSGPFEIYLAGYPNAGGVTLQLENVATGLRLNIRPAYQPGTTWQRYAFATPADWCGKDLRLIAEDHSVLADGWFGFSLPHNAAGSENRRAARQLLLQTLLFSLLTFLPGITLSAFAISKGVRGTIKPGLIAMAGISLPGYLLFFVYVLSPRAGMILSTFWPYAMAAWLIFLMARLSHRKRKQVITLCVPLVAVLFASLGVLSLGYLYGGINAPNSIAEHRFSHPLPPDNAIPYNFAAALLHGPVPKPMEGNWLSSDRPPLQTGMILALTQWTKGRQIYYHIDSVVIQSLWIFSLWLMLRAFRVSRLATALVLVSALSSGFIIVNTFYVWPKLLAATYLIGFAIPALAARPQARKVSWLLRLLLPFLLVSSLLAHGATTFALAGLLIVLLCLRRMVAKEVCITSVIALVLYSPWMGYQKFVDPPGDRLLKWHLAGVEAPTSQTAIQTIYAAYRQRTFASWLSSRESNFGTMFGHELDYLKDTPGFLTSKTQVDLRVFQFFYLLPALGFFIIAFACFLIPRKLLKTRGMGPARLLFFWSIASAVVWMLLMFEPLSTVVHQGPYVMVLTAMAASILALRACAPLLALVICAMQCVFTWVIYWPDLSQVEYPASLPAASNHWLVALFSLSAAGFLSTMLMGSWQKRVPGDTVTFLSLCSARLRHPKQISENSSTS